MTCFECVSDGELRSKTLCFKTTEIFLRELRKVFRPRSQNLNLVIAEPFWFRGEKFHYVKHKCSGIIP